MTEYNSIEYFIEHFPLIYDFKDTPTTIVVSAECTISEQEGELLQEYIFNRTQIDGIIKSVEYLDKENKIQRKGEFKKESGKIFSNSVSIMFALDDSSEDPIDICMKIFSNKNVHITGARSQNQIDLVTKTVIEMCPRIASIKIVKYPLINYNFRPINSYHTICLDQLAQSLRKRYSDIEINSEVKKYITVKHDGNTYIVYPSCKIKISTSSDFARFHDCRRFVTECIVTPLREFLVYNKITHAITLVHKSLFLPEQRSQAWKDQRMKCLTASELAKVLSWDGHSSGDTRGKLLAEKLSGKSSFTGNIATDFGTRYEPIAGAIWEKECNMSRHSYVLIYEVNSLEKGYVSASSDGFVFVFRKDTPGFLEKTQSTIGCPEERKYSCEELLEMNTQGYILDVYLIEIKCPFRYCKYISEKTYTKAKKPKLIPCKAASGGFIPRYYWTQTQQQMYVTDIDLCVFLNCNIWQSNHEPNMNYVARAKYFGAVASVQLTDGETISIYPTQLIAPTEYDLLTQRIELLRKIASHIHYSYTIHYWYCMDADNCRVHFDAEFMNGTALPAIDSFMADLAKARETYVSEISVVDDEF